MAPYNVPIKNRFAQLDSDVEDESGGGDQRSTTNKQQQAQQQQGKDKTFRPSSKATGPMTTKPQGTSLNAPSSFGGSPSSPSSKGTTGHNSSQRFPGARGPRTNNPEGGAVVVSNGIGEAPAGPTLRKQRDFSGPDRPERMAARGRPLRGGFGGAISNKREFDRHSGTGRGREMKKGGGGGHNWGSTKLEDNAPDEVDAEGKQEVVEGEGGPVEGTVPEPAAEGGATPTPTPPPEDNSIDFAEYRKAMKAKRAAVLALQQNEGLETRVVGADELEKDGFQKYKKEETEDERAAREMQKSRMMIHNSQDEEQETPERQSRRPPKPSSAMMSLFGSDFGASRYNRGGRGGGMGRGGRGGSQQMMNQQQQQPPQHFNQPPIQIDLADQAAFPSL